ncbi:MAG: undecaprenyl-diphosphate phosphatase [Candidatus Omnitrophica bacterium]|nr:undecaprenyl-diphosphate phosphatase [Candidatus Omnitrophota bacterium]
MINISKIAVLAVVQGVSELLPVSSSAHVIVAEKLMGLDPTKPEMTLLLVMLHTGTMFAVIVFFWNSWKTRFFRSPLIILETIKCIAVATAATGFIGLSLKILIEKFILKGVSHPEIEMLFGKLLLISAALAAVGALILLAGYKESRSRERTPLGLKSAFLIGLVQGICLPFRGFSRSGATISTGLVLGIEKKLLEDFSFALAVILTPPVILMEAIRFFKGQHAALHHGASAMGLFLPSLIGMILSFISGILALKWLSDWLERGRWYLFGIYCLCASAVIFLLYCRGL